MFKKMEIALDLGKTIVDSRETKIKKLDRWGLMKVLLGYVLGVKDAFCLIVIL